jgi:hypothetical protein
MVESVPTSSTSKFNVSGVHGSGEDYEESRYVITYES